MNPPTCLSRWKQVIGSVIERMRQRPDSEHQQAAIRLILGGLI